MIKLLGIFGFLVVLLRAATLCFQSVTIGGTLFFNLVARPTEPQNDALLRSAWKLIRWAALGLAVTQLIFVIANSLVLSATVEIPLKDVLGANFIWAGALAFVAALAIAFSPAQLRQRIPQILLIPAAIMLASSVMTSHSASRVNDRPLLVALTVVHYLATASWIGGLPFLLLAMKKLPDGPSKATIMRRFSWLAQISVALLIAAGLGMSWVYVGSIEAIYGTAYGVMVSTKVILLMCLLVLGAANFYIVKGIGATGGGPGVKSLFRFGEAEIGIGLTIILAAASLTSQPPGVDLTQDRVTLHEITARFTPRMPRFESPRESDFFKSAEVVFNQSKAAGEVSSPPSIPGERVWHPDDAEDIAWSEYNHNWAGLIVLLMGLLAMLSRLEYFSWAKVWPLMFLGLAIFLFFRADPETWPLGPQSFWGSWGKADIVQHRMAVVLIVVFAIFQYRVETNRLKSMAASLVFPAVCALGGVVLLTHTHALGNIKEEMLAELSHTPLAIFGIIAGWSRWLELRLPRDNQAHKYLKWIWPICFILVGLILLDYHES
jgi:putative copper resistance protein D